jgi:hypothetical protein
MVCRDLLKIRNHFFKLVWTNNPMNRIMIAFSSISNFQVRLPAGELYIIIHIRDTLDCITDVNLTSNVVPDIVDLINNLQGSEDSSMVRLLASGNQNTVGQIIISISQQSNQMNDENIGRAISSKSSFIKEN